MAFASRKLLHGAGGTITQGVAANTVRMSFGLDGLWQFIAGLLGSVVHLLVLPFEALWHLLQTAATGALHLLVLPFEALWQWLQTATASISFGFDGLWQLIRGFFPNLLAALAGAALKLVLPFEAFWRWIQTTVTDAAAGISFGLDGFWQLIRRFFGNLLITLAGEAHEFIQAFEAFWRWLETAAAAALPTVLLIAAVVCLVALIWFFGPVLCAPVVGIAKALVHLVCWRGWCLHNVAMWVGRALRILLPVCRYCCICCVSVTMKAPGAAGYVISRAAFVANPQLYFQILRSAGAIVASAVFSTTSVASAVAAPVAALFRF